MSYLMEQDWLITHAFITIANTTTMITQYDLHFLIRKEIPQLASKVYSSRCSLEIYACINYFTDYTMNAVKVHDFDTAKKCFVLAENLYLNGDRLVRSLIEKNFVYAFSLHKTHSRTDDFIVRSVITKTLNAIYKIQLMQMGN